MELQTNLTVLNHPIISHNLAIIRDKNSDCERFKNALRRITYSLVYEATKAMPLMDAAS
jgi:uracil phosphoribosyltransferase